MLQPIRWDRIGSDRIGCHVSTQHTAHSTQRAAFSTQHTVHSAQYTSHSAQSTAHSAQLTAHSTQRTAHSAQRTPCYAPRRSFQGCRNDCDVANPLLIALPMSTAPLASVADTVDTTNAPSVSRFRGLPHMHMLPQWPVVPFHENQIAEIVD